MKRRLPHTFTHARIGLFVAVAVALVGLYTLQFSRAATGRLYLTPATSTLTPGGLVTLALRIDPGTDINGAGGELTYDATKIEPIDFSDAGTAFPYILESDSSSGRIKIIKATDGSTVNTDSLIVTLTFRALGSSGSTPIALAGNAGFYDNLTNPAVEGATITFSSPAATAPPPTPNAPSPTTPSSQSPPPAATPQTPQQSNPATDQPNTEGPDQPMATDHTPISASNRTLGMLLWAIPPGVVLILGGSYFFIRKRLARQLPPPPTAPQASVPTGPAPLINKVPWPKNDDPGTIIRPKQQR